LPVGANAQVCRDWKEAVRIGELQVQLKEDSGMAVSRRFPGRVYHINDSGDAGKFYITNVEGKDTQAVAVTDFAPRDTEAISLGPCPSKGVGSCLYLGDIGDNDRNRKSIEIVVIDEVEKFSQSVKPRSRIQLRYPDGPHDTESMAVHPDGTIFLLTKERPGRLFKVNAEQKLALVRTVDAGRPATDMAISDDGTRMLVLTYVDAVELSIDFKQEQKIHLNFLQQQESITYLPGSRSFIYSTERLLPSLPQWIMRVDCNDRN